MKLKNFLLSTLVTAIVILLFSVVGRLTGVDTDFPSGWVSACIFIYLNVLK